MKTKTNKLIFLICILALLLSLFLGVTFSGSAETAFADADIDYSTIFTYTTDNNEVTITGFNSTYLSTLDDEFNIALTIPATINGAPVVAIGTRAFAFTCTYYSAGTNPETEYKVTSLSFENATNLKTIGEGAFAGFTATGTLTLPANLSGIDIGSSAFIYSSFEAFEASDDTINSIASNAFKYSAISGHVVIPEGVITYGGTVFGYTEVTSISLPSTITSISTYAFSNMISLEFAKINFTFSDSITDANGAEYTTSSKFMNQSLSSNPVVVLNGEASYNYIYALTLSSNQDSLTYELTLTFDGLDNSYNRDVLYNRAINLKEDENGITWSADESYFLPTLETGMRWNFTGINALVTDDIITPESNVAGDTLYAVSEENVFDQYYYFEFGSYPQTQLGHLSQGSMTDEEFKAAIEEKEAEYEEQGIEVYCFESSDSLVYWFEMEPILWRILATETDGDITAYRLWSEYVIDQQPIGENAIYTDGFTSTPLYSWLQDDFKETAFVEYEKDFIKSITLMDCTVFGKIKEWGVNHLKAFKSDFANYIGSSAYYWLSYTYTSSYAYSLIGYVGTSSNSYGAWYNGSDAGVRPDITISQDTTKYATTGTGTYADPYKFVLIETVENTLSDEETLTADAQFELSFSNSDATIYYKINDGETQTYNSDSIYYISENCTLTAWADIDGTKSEEKTWVYTVEKTTNVGLVLSNFEETDEIIVGDENSTPENFDVVVLPGIDTNEQTSLEAEIPSGYEIVDSFHLYATVNGDIVQGAEFSNYVSITLSNELESSKTYQLLHLEDGEDGEDGEVVVLSEENGKLSVNREDNSISFDVNNLSPFMLVSTTKTTSSSSSSNITLSSSYTVGGTSSSSTSTEEETTEPEATEAPATTETPVATETPTATIAPVVPETQADSSSNAWIWIVLGVLVVGGIAGVVVYKKKKQ